MYCHNTIYTNKQEQRADLECQEIIIQIRTRRIIRPNCLYTTIRCKAFDLDAITILNVII